MMMKIENSENQKKENLNRVQPTCMECETCLNNSYILHRNLSIGILVIVISWFSIKEVFKYSLLQHSNVYLDIVVSNNEDQY